MSQETTLQQLTRDQLNDALIRINIPRTREPSDPVGRDLLEGAFEAMFGVSRHLIAYGTLAPGGPNHGLLDGLKGEWKRRDG